MSDRIPGLEEERPLAKVDRVLSDLVPGYLENRKGDVVRLRDWSREGRRVEVERLLHQIKGTGGSYGFGPLSEWAKATEAKVKAGSLEIEEELRKVLSYLERVEVTYVDET